MRVHALMFGFFAIATSLEAAAEDRLTPLLAYVPANAIGDPANGDMVSFIDFAALRQSANASIPLLDQFRYTAFDRELAALARLNGGPAMIVDYIQYAPLHQLESMATYVGFGWSEIEASVGFYNRPASVTVLVGSAALSDTDAIGAALTSHDYAFEERSGFPFWWYLEDDRMELTERNTENPLRGHLGGSARLGLVDGAVVMAANWPAIDSTLVSFGGASASLATDRDMAALAEALNLPVTGEGALLQATLMGGAFEVTDLVAGIAGPSASEEQREAIRNQLGVDLDNVTPVYRAIGLGDRQEGSETIGLVALVYDNEQDAETAARTVPEAFATLDSVATRQPFSEILTGSVSTRIIPSLDDTRFVAIIAFSTQLPPREGPLAMPPTPYRRLIDMLTRLDIGPLAAGTY